MDIQTLDFLKNLKNIWIQRKIPNISEIVWVFLFDLIWFCDFKNWIEIWSANWYSSIFIWKSLRENGWKLKTFEIDKKIWVEFLENISWVGLDQNIEFFNIDFLSYELEKKEIFDFVFIDWKKRLYKDFFLKIKPHINKDSVFAFDNIKKFWFKMWDFFDEIAKEKDFDFIEIEFDDMRNDSICLFFDKKNKKIYDFLNQKNLNYSFL